MEITITRTGGLAGVRQVLGPVSTSNLAEAEKIEHLVDDMKFFALPDAIPSSGGADVFFYETVITDRELPVLPFITHTVRSDDLAEEPYRGQLSTLIDLLETSG
jgi:hypothetical protein